MEVGEAGGVPQSVLGSLSALQLLTELQETSYETDCAMAANGHSVSRKFSQSELTDGIPKLRFFFYSVIYPVYIQLIISIVIFIYIYTQITI